jgi:geranylgeranylglycerol-phosphate geranylgeranyltransferase
MAFEISPGIRAALELIRLDLAFGAGFFVVAGECFALGGLPPAREVLLGFVTLFFISGSANVANDYFDREVDRVNIPTRPLPSGLISVRRLWLLFFLCSAAGLAAAALLGPRVLLLAAVFWGIALLYNVKLKEYGIAGNLVVATCVSMTVLFGGIVAGAVNGLVLTFAALAFLFDLAAEIASDAMDMEGDVLRSTGGLAKWYGRNRALRVAGIILGLFAALAFLPDITGWLGTGYLVLAALFGTWTIWCTVNLVRSRTSVAGRVQVRRLYLAWGLFVVVTAVSLIL